MISGGRCLTLGTAAALLLALGAAAQEPYRVRDLNTLDWPVGSEPDGLVRVGQVVFFTAEDGRHGRELWKTDGSPAGTVLVRDIRPGGDSSSPRYLTAVGGLLFFSADDGHAGRELWRSDGTFRGTWRVADIYPGPSGSRPFQLTAMGNRLYFQAFEPAAGRELWRSDGTRPGTARVTDLAPGPDGSSPTNLTVFKGRLYFIARVRDSPDDRRSRRRTWSTDGTGPGTVALLDASTDRLMRPDHLTAVGDILYFVSEYRELWRSDGTREGTALFLDGGNGDPTGYHLLTSALGLLFYAACDDDGVHLWSSDGTREGTRRLRLFVSGRICYSISPGIIEADSWIFFRARGLWRSDGSPEGTFQIADPWEGSGVSGSGWNDPNVVWNAGVLFFPANEGGLGWELWRSDGTPAGTYLAADIRAGEPSSDPRHLAALGNRILFGALSGAVTDSNRELWMSDGTASGTRQLKDIWTATRTASIRSVIGLGERIAFSADDGVRGQELWTSDGTTIGTRLVRDINPGEDGSFPENSALVEGRLFLAADDGRHGVELWTSDFSPAGTRQVRDIAPGPASSLPRDLAAVGGQLFFTADDGISGREPWRSDGTAAGTRLLGDPTSPSGSINFAGTEFVDFEGTAYFRADDGVTGRELWRSDGTAAGTRLVVDLAPGPESSGPGFLTEFGGRLYFAARSAGGWYSELWRSDTTPSGTRQVIPPEAAEAPIRVTLLEAIGDLLFFRAGRSGTTGSEPWTSDGTAEGTREVKTLSDQPNGSQSGPFVDLDGRALFSADPPGPKQVFVSDGTAAGTLPLTDLPVNSLTLHFFPLATGGRAVFTAWTRETGLELWATDGTRSGTGLFADLVPGEPNSAPRPLAAARGRFYFAARDARGDEELWAYRPLDLDAARRATALPGLGPLASPVVAILDPDGGPVELRDARSGHPLTELSLFDRDWSPLGLGVVPATPRSPAKIAVLARNDETSAVEVRIGSPFLHSGTIEVVRFGHGFRPGAFEVIAGDAPTRLLLVAAGRRRGDWAGLVVARDLEGALRFRLVLPDGTAILRLVEIPDFSGNARPEIGVLYRTAGGGAGIVILDTEGGGVLRRHRLPAGLEPVSVAVMPQATDAPASALVVLGYRRERVLAVAHALDADTGRYLGGRVVGLRFRAMGIESLAGTPVAPQRTVAVAGRSAGGRLEVRLVDPLGPATGPRWVRFPPDLLPQDLVVWTPPPGPAGAELAILGWSPRDGSLRLVPGD